METTLSTPHRPSPPQSPPLTANLRRPHHLLRRRHVHYQARLPMPLIDLTLRRITAANPCQLRFNHHHNHIIITSIFPKTMAGEQKETDTQTTELSVGESGDEEKKEAEQPPPPPPPEKPMPADCCGSGCVRCVWDVYLEELDEYNKLCKPNSF